MLTFNGKRFAKNDAEFTGSLFQPGGTCCGYYKRLRNGIKLYDQQHQLQAFLVDNRHGERFVVTAYTFPGDGRDRFMHSTTTSTARWLGIEGLKYGDDRALIDAALASMA